MQSGVAGQDETIYLIGPNGWPNYGDEYPAATWLRYLAKVKPEAEVVLDCHSPGLASYLFDGIHPHLKTTDMIWRTIFESIEEPDEIADAEIDRIILDLGSPRWDFGLIGARRATTIHLMGGGYITDQWPHHIRLLRAGLRLREASNAKLVATGLGLVPTQRGHLLKDYLSQFDSASVRDQASSEVSGAPMVCNDAFLDLPNLAAVANRARSNAEVPDGDVIVDIQRDLVTSEAYEEIVDCVRDLLTTRYAGRKVRYLESIPGRDKIAYDILADATEDAEFVPFVSMWHEPFPAAPGQVWLTTRYHLHLLAAACGASGIAFEVDDDYYRTKHQSLIDHGTGWAVRRLGDAEVPPASVDVGFRIASAKLHRAKLDEAVRIYG